MLQNSEVQGGLWSGTALYAILTNVAYGGEHVNIKQLKTVSGVLISFAYHCPESFNKWF